MCNQTEDKFFGSFRLHNFTEERIFIYKYSIKNIDIAPLTENYTDAIKASR